MFLNLVHVPTNWWLIIIIIGLVATVLWLLYGKYFRELYDNFNQFTQALSNACMDAKRDARLAVKHLKHGPRERLKVMYYIVTDKACYIMYNTQTVPYDCANIEIERIENGCTFLILEDKISDDGFGGMGGDSFLSLALSARYNLYEFIKERGETIRNEAKELL